GVGRADAPADRPLTRAPGRADLVTQVQVDGRPAGAGRLVVGFREALKPPADGESAARPETAGWRWLEGETGADGTAHLPGPAPGRYLVRRYWLPAGAPAKPGRLADPLAWRNAVVEVELRQDQVATLPPLISPPPPSR